MSVFDLINRVATRGELLNLLRKTEEQRAHLDRELSNLKEEVRVARKEWVGDDAGHLPLCEALGKVREDMDKRADEAEEDGAKLRQRIQEIRDAVDLLKSSMRSDGNGAHDCRTGEWSTFLEIAELALSA